MTTAVLAIRLVMPEPSVDQESLVATLTVEVSPWLIRGMRLFRKPDGTHYLKGPMMRVADDRVVLHRGLERDTLLRQSVAMYRAMADVHRAAVPPFAPAPELESSTNGDPP